MSAAAWNLVTALLALVAFVTGALAMRGYRKRIAWLERELAGQEQLTGRNREERRRGPYGDRCVVDPYYASSGRCSRGTQGCFVDHPREGE